jgi:uncharacterized protein YbbC (DUF1343 family)
MTVATGLERFMTERSWRKGLRRIGLLTNHSAVDRGLRPAVRVLQECPDLTLARLYSPEHGLWGVQQDMAPVDDTSDPLTGLPVTSLYGAAEESLRVQPQALSDIDALVFDIQDIGTRYYTYAATLALAMETCAAAGLPCVVLDRPNPITGTMIEGNIGDEALRSFVGTIPVPQRHGLTVGELARVYRQRRSIRCDLRVVPCTGWPRGDWFNLTGLPWVLPSPNMPTLNTALVYPGMCLVEATTLSEGRGTTRPFEICGAPFVEPGRLTSELDAMQLPGAAWRPLFFRPTFHKLAEQVCGGVQLHVLDRTQFLPLSAGLAFIWQVRRLWPEHFAWRPQAYEFRAGTPAMDLLCGTSRVREALDAGLPFDEVYARAVAGGEQFEEERRGILLYR